MKISIKYLFQLFPICAALFITTHNVNALPFGIYEPRSLAMGGTGVAVSNSYNAVHYNPSLLAQHKKYKEQTGKQAFSFPVTAGRVSKTLEDLDDINDRNYDSSVSSAINTYNASPTVANADNALSVIQNLHNDLALVSNKLILADLSASLVIGIPSKHQGGAFYILQRGVGDGNINITNSDTSLIQDYREALLFISSGGTQGSAHPELFSGGNLIDPINSLTSTANARAAVITELGVSMSSEYILFGSKIALSVKPKTYKIKTFDYSSTITSNNVSKTNKAAEQWNVNLDFGASYNINKNWRVGLVAKDLISKDFTTQNGNTIKITPQIRMGAAYLNPSYIITADIDVIENEGVFENNKSQYLLTGIEVPYSIFKFRAGYRYSIQSKPVKEDGLISAGLGIHFKSFYFDLAYTENSQQYGAGLSIGYIF